MANMYKSIQTDFINRSGTMFYLDELFTFRKQTLRYFVREIRLMIQWFISMERITITNAAI